MSKDKPDTKPGQWLPNPLFSSEERAAFVKSHGEEWVRNEERLMGNVRDMMDFISGMK